MMTTKDYPGLVQVALGSVNGLLYDGTRLKDSITIALNKAHKKKLGCPIEEKGKYISVQKHSVNYMLHETVVVIYCVDGNSDNYVLNEDSLTRGLVEMISELGMRTDHPRWVLLPGYKLLSYDNIDVLMSKLDMLAFKHKEYRSKN